MRHRGPFKNPLNPGPSNAQPGTRTSALYLHRRPIAVTAALASLAAGALAVSIGTSSAAPSNSSVAGANLLPNPGFENGLTGWTRSGANVTTSAAHHNGAHAADLAAPSVSANATTARKNRQLTMTLSTDASAVSVAGGVYQASVWASAPHGAAEAVLRLTEMRGTTVVGQRAARTHLWNTKWHTLALTYTAAATGDTLKFSVVANGVLPGRTVLADDAALTLTTDPSPSATDSPTPSTTATTSPTPTPSDSPTSTPSATPSTTPTTTPSSPPPGNGSTLIGSTFGTSMSGTEAQFPNMGVTHFYYGGPPSVWGGAMASIPSGQAIMVSFNYDVSATAAGGSDAAFTQVLRSWAVSGRTIYWNWQHEADNPAKGISPAAYQAGWAHLLADAAAVNAPNLHSMSIIMAIALTGVHGPVDSWYIPGVDVIGFDSYYLSTELLAEQYAAAKGKPLAFPEFGAAIGGSPDAASAAFAQAFIAALDSNTIAAVWFNNNGNELATHPATLAVLKAAAG